jgi:hypothetical protein
MPPNKHKHPRSKFLTHLVQGLWLPLLVAEEVHSRVRQEVHSRVRQEVPQVYNNEIKEIINNGRKWIRWKT